jgi:hypothetical protein
VAVIQVPDPRVYTPREYQIPFQSFMENGGKRYVGLWHRRAGKDLSALAWTAKEAVKNPGIYWHIGPMLKQARKFVWNGMTVDTFNPSKSHRYRDMFPRDLVRRERDDDMMIELVNGSIWQVLGTDDPSALVGPNPRGIVFSEYSIQNPAAWDYLAPILAENDGWAVFIYTARGRNHGYQLYQTAQRMMAEHPGRWMAENLTIDVTKKRDPNGVMVPVVTPAMIDEERERGVSEEHIQQEFYNSFDAPLHGAYYGDIIRDLRKAGRMERVPYDPDLPVETWWDIGFDATAIIFLQKHQNERRFIDFEMEPNGSLDYWIKKVNEKPYIYSNHIGPWDLKVRDYVTKKRRIDEALRLGIRFDVCKRHFVDDGISQVRRYLRKYHCIFDSEKCERLIDALLEYHREWNEDKQTFEEKPVHDWASHPADAFRQGVMKEPDVDSRSVFRPPVAESDYNPLEGIPDRGSFRSPQADRAISEFDPFGGY